MEHENWDHSIDGSWFVPEKYLPEDDSCYDVLSYLTGNGFVIKKKAFYDKSKKKWFEKDKNKVIPVIAWKIIY